MLNTVLLFINATIFVLLWLLYIFIGLLVDALHMAKQFLWIIMGGPFSGLVHLVPLSLVLYSYCLPSLT